MFFVDIETTNLIVECLEFIGRHCFVFHSEAESAQCFTMTAAKDIKVSPFHIEISALNTDFELLKLLINRRDGAQDFTTSLAVNGL